MPKASSKRRKKKREDEAQAAVRVMSTIAEKSEAESEPEPVITDEMRQVAAAFGRIGGKIGGVKRAQSLSPKKRSEIARAAARARWRKG